MLLATFISESPNSVESLQIMLKEKFPSNLKSSISPIPKSNETQREFFKFSLLHGEEMIESLAFDIRAGSILAVKSHSQEIIEGVINRINSYLRLRNQQTTFKELKFSHANFISWVEKSSQILECNILLSPYGESESKLIGGNLKKSELFLERIKDATITRMVFTLEGFEDYLLTTKKNGRIALTPDPSDNDTVGILAMLLKTVEVFLA